MYKNRVPGQRHSDQTQIAFALPLKLSAAIETARRKSGDDRSTFIRKAAVAKIRTTGVPVEDEWAMAPSRTRPSSTADRKALEAAFLAKKRTLNRRPIGEA